MVQKLLLVVLLVLGMPLAQGLASDHHMRCGTKLVSLGDSKAEVLINCGEPLLKETIAIREDTEYSELRATYPLLEKNGLLKEKDTAAAAGSKSSLTLPIDQWTYNIGSGKFLRLLIFQGGRLVAIEKGDRM